MADKDSENENQNEDQSENEEDAKIEEDAKNEESKDGGVKPAPAAAAAAVAEEIPESEAPLVGAAVTEITWKIIVECTDAQLQDFMDHQIFGIEEEGVYWKKREWQRQSLSNGTMQQVIITAVLVDDMISYDGIQE